MNASRYKVVIVGGGVVGLAVALEMTRRFPQQRLLLLEKEASVARHQSGHNSGVIHSGIYYKPGSLKARLCVAGAAAMIEFCREHGVPHKVCGKVIVATREEEFPRLEELARRGEANGLTGVRELGPEELREVEPHDQGTGPLGIFPISNFVLWKGQQARSNGAGSRLSLAWFSFCMPFGRGEDWQSEKLEDD